MFTLSTLTPAAHQPLATPFWGRKMQNTANTTKDLVAATMQFCDYQAQCDTHIDRNEVPLIAFINKPFGRTLWIEAKVDLVGEHTKGITINTLIEKRNGDREDRHTYFIRPDGRVLKDGEPSSNAAANALLQLIRDEAKRTLLPPQERDRITAQFEKELAYAVLRNAGEDGKVSPPFGVVSPFGINRGQEKWHQKEQERGEALRAFALEFYKERNHLWNLTQVPFALELHKNSAFIDYMVDIQRKAGIL